MTARAVARLTSGALLVSAFFAWLLLRPAVLEVATNDTIVALLHGLAWASLLAGAALIAKAVQAGGPAERSRAR